MKIFLKCFRAWQNVVSPSSDCEGREGSVWLHFPSLTCDLSPASTL